MAAAENLVAAGERAVAAGDLAAAAATFEEALAADPSAVPALLWLARLALLGERPLAARVLLTRLLAVSPGHPEGLALMGVERLAAGDAGSALDWSVDSRAADPGCALAWGLASKAHLALGENDRAAVAGRRALELAPGDFETRFTLAELAAAEGRGEEAVDHLVSALEANPRYLVAYLALGTLYSELGRRDLARRLYEEGSRHLPQVELLQARLAALA